MSDKMQLSVNIGNTNISFGLFKGNTIVKRYSFATREKDCCAALKRIFSGEKIEDAVICSVVPSVSRKIEKNLYRLLGRKPLVIGRDIKVPLRNLYARPKQLGQDRLVNAYAGERLYGAPVILVDFGTAITFDAVSRGKEYLGGMILPGLKLSLEALSRNTALLPGIKLNPPRQFIGKDTKSGILSGVVYGFAALTDGLVKKIKSSIGKSAMVIGTGGNIALMAGYCQSIDKINPDLTLQGMNLLYRQWKSR